MARDPDELLDRPPSEHAALVDQAEVFIDIALDRHYRGGVFSVTLPKFLSFSAQNALARRYPRWLVSFREDPPYTTTVTLEPAGSCEANS